MIGPLGVGKTTLLKSLSETYKHNDFRLIFEDLSRIRAAIEYWAEDKESRSFFMQSVYYLDAYTQLMIDIEEFKVVVSDSSMLFHHYGYTEYLHGQGLLNDLEFNHLKRIHTDYIDRLPSLAGVIYCHASFESIFNRVALRSRQLENDTTKSMIEKLLISAANLVKRLEVPVLDLDLDLLSLSDATDKAAIYLQAWQE